MDAITDHLTPQTTAIAALGIPLSIWLLRQATAPRKNLFPSPPSDPVLGHVRSVPPEFPWYKFAEWSRQYGDVISLSMMGMPAVVVSSVEAAKDLFEKQGGNNSDRPRALLHGKILHDDHLHVLMSYNDEYKLQRRLVHQQMSASAVKYYQPMQTKQVRGLLKRLLEKPDGFVTHVEDMSAANILEFTYGYYDSAVANMIIEAMGKSMGLGVPGMTPVDLLPFLQHMPLWFPGTGGVKLALESKKMFQKAMDEPFDEVKKQRAQGGAPPSMAGNMLEESEKNGTHSDYIELQIKNVSHALFGAGYETTMVAIVSFILMMARHPEVLRKAQAELDSVTGGLALPSFADRPNMPYLECVLKEVFRINPPLPLGILHVSRDEATYRDKTIPKQSMIFPNIWQMMRDERHFPNGDKFDPERHFARQTSEDHVRAMSECNGEDPRSIVYGFGRRICPGRFLADATIWLSLANMIAVFDILPSLDPTTGKEIPPAAEYVHGLTSKPKPFKCRIVPRSEKHASLIKQECQ